MAANLIFFCMHINWPSWPRFRVKIILNFLHDNEVIKANLYAYKRILNRRPFMIKVYIICGNTPMRFKSWIIQEDDNEERCKFCFALPRKTSFHFIMLYANTSIHGVTNGGTKSQINFLWILKHRVSCQSHYKLYGYLFTLKCMVRDWPLIMEVCVCVCVWRVGG